MATNGSKEVAMSTSELVDSCDSTVEIKIKTLDSQTYTLRVNKCVPVPALKEKIATVTGVVSDQQRLICRGKVLQDNELLSAYNVEDGHTLHLVVRQPFTTSSSPSTSFGGSESAFSHPGTNSVTNATSNDHGRGTSIVFETVNIGQGDPANQGLNQIMGNILSSLMALNGGPGNTRIDHREMDNQRQDRASADTGAATLQSSPAIQSVEFDPQQTGLAFPAAAPVGSQHPMVIPDSLTTINQYLGLMRDEFRSEGLRSGGNELNNNVEASGHENETQNQDLQSRATSGQAGLPNPSVLAEIMLNARDLLVQEAGGCLYQLARQLENQGSIAAPSMRTNIQASAMRVGVLLQNLGPLLLELGRTIMTLRIGQTPSDAVVNAGPAIFISSSGPNPMMVQPVPFLPGANFGRVHMGSLNSGRGREGQPFGSTFIPRSIEIQIHTGRPAPVASGNQDEQVGGEQQRQGQTDSARTAAGANFIHPAFSGGPGNAPSGDSGIRLVPRRTIVSVPAGVGPSTSESSGNGSGLFYPLIARVQQLSVNANNARGSQVSSGSQPQGSENVQQNLESNNGGAVRDTNSSPTSSSPATNGMGSSANESARYQGSARVYISGRRRPLINNDDISQAQNGQHTGQGSRAHIVNRIDQFIRNIFMGEDIQMSESGQQNSGAGSVTDHSRTTTDPQAHEASVVDEQAIHFSNLVRQLMPYLSQGRGTEQDVSMNNPSSSMVQTETENQTNSRSSGHLRDPPEDPQNFKRQKRG